MGIELSSLIDAPIDDVFAWHERPGAIHRLAPPWQPVFVRRESTSLRDGTAVLWVPPGLRWVARHRPDGYRPPEQFVDELISSPLRRVLSWRHVHGFEAVDAGTTRVTDRIDTPVPTGILRPLVHYRHRQLAGDLAAHRRARRMHDEPLTIAVTGSSGLIGTALAAYLSTGGHRVVRLVRRPPETTDERWWRPDDPAPDLLAGVDAVIHLAGASIAGRFTRRHRQKLRDSRIGPTRRLAEVAAATAGLRCFVSASAIGFYGADRGDEELTETSPRGDGFLADVVADWEAAAEPAREAGLRVVNVRTGLVQTPRGGVLRIFYPQFLAGLGGALGDGHQWNPWIGIDDLLDVYLRAVVDETLAGPVNAVAPMPVRNAEYARVLAHVLHRPAFLGVPRLGPRLILGEQGAEELAEAGQLVVPRRLTEAGHVFRHAELGAALRHLLGRTPPDVHQPGG